MMSFFLEHNFRNKTCLIPVKKYDIEKVLGFSQKVEDPNLVLLSFRQDTIPYKTASYFNFADFVDEGSSFNYPTYFSQAKTPREFILEYSDIKEEVLFQNDVIPTHFYLVGYEVDNYFNCVPVIMGVDYIGEGVMIFYLRPKKAQVWKVASPHLAVSFLAQDDCFEPIILPEKKTVFPGPSGKNISLEFYLEEYRRSRGFQ
jgi:hypothetical protein